MTGQSTNTMLCADSNGEIEIFSGSVNQGTILL